MSPVTTAKQNIPDPTLYVPKVVEVFQIVLVGIVLIHLNELVLH